MSTLSYSSGLALAAAGLGLGLALSACTPQRDTKPPVEDPVACTEDAKVCPDGSAVGREGPDCEFPACPGEAEAEAEAEAQAEAEAEADSEAQAEAEAAAIGDS